jgi:uncharacterized protein YjiS (DUF1127 family)
MACSNHDSFLRRCGAVLRIWVARARQRRALRELDDRLLGDIGLTRVDAERECAKPFWHPLGRPGRLFPLKSDRAGVRPVTTGR